MSSWTHSVTVIGVEDNSPKTLNDKSHQALSQKSKQLGTEGFENRRTSRDFPDYSIVEVGQNSEKSPGDLRRLAVTRTPVKNYQLTLVRKTLKMTKITMINEKELKSLIQSIRIYTRDIGIEFRIKKCTMLIRKSGERERNKSGKN